jgi:hypothetical protein
MSKETKKRASQKSETEYLKYSFGVDISKGKFDVCISAIDKEQYLNTCALRTFSNNESGFKALLDSEPIKNQVLIWHDFKLAGKQQIINGYYESWIAKTDESNILEV